MARIITEKVSFKQFKELASIHHYGKKGSGLYHVYYGYKGEPYGGYTYRIKLHGGNKEQALRASYFMLFFNTFENNYVQTGEFKFSITFGAGDYSLDCEDFNAEFLKYKIDLHKNLWKE